MSSSVRSKPPPWPNKPQKLLEEQNQPPPWPNKPRFDSTPIHTERFSATPTISPLASPSTISPTTSTPCESYSTTSTNKCFMTTTGTESFSASPWHIRVRNEKSRTTSTTSEVQILLPASAKSHKSFGKSISTTLRKYSTTITSGVIRTQHRAENSIAHWSSVTSKPIFFSSSAANSGKKTPDFEDFTCKK